MKTLYDLLERLPHACHMVVNISLSAEPAGYLGGTAQLVAGHTREEMVNGLVVQAAIEEVDERGRAHVAGCKHLLAHEIQLLVIVGYYQHTLVVGRKDRTDKEAKQAPVKEDEDEPLPEPE